MADVISFSSFNAHTFTARANEAITGGTFVCIVGDLADDDAVDPLGDSRYGVANMDDDGYPLVGYAAGTRAFGVAARDAAAGEVVSVYVGGSALLPVIAGAAIGAGVEVTCDAQGRAVLFDDSATSAKATLATGVEGNNNGITWTADDEGAQGNSISVALVDPGENDAALEVAVSNSAITVYLATDGAGAITSTATEVIAAVEAHADAAALVDVADTGASTGAAAVTAVAATNLSGGTTDNRPSGLACGRAAAADELLMVKVY